MASSRCSRRSRPRSRRFRLPRAPPTPPRRRRSREARPLLGHARVAARGTHRPGASRAHRRRRAGRTGSCARLGRRRRGLRRQPWLCRRGHVRRPHPLRRDRDRRAGLRAVRPRQRRSSVRPGRAREARSGGAADLSRLHVPRALGPHHGPAVLRARVHPRQSDRHLRRPRGARVRVAAADGAAVVPGAFRHVQGRHRIRAPRSPACATTSPG